MANCCNTLNRQDICRFTQQSIAYHGWASTFTQIEEGVCIPSRGQVKMHLTQLEQEGDLPRQHQTVRTICLTEAGKALTDVEILPEQREPVIPRSAYISSLEKRRRALNG